MDLVFDFVCPLEGSISLESRLRISLIDLPYIQNIGNMSRSMDPNGMYGYVKGGYLFSRISYLRYIDQIPGMAKMMTNYQYLRFIFTTKSVWRTQ